MRQHRTILHSDLNCFFASVELLLNPVLRGRPVAVCGNTEERHGIVLAKSEEAKRAGVKTAMPNWQARQLCPELVIVPPQYEQYQKYSKIVFEFYRQYTNRVEPFGMDECWLDLTGCTGIGSGQQAAETIRQRLREEIGLTVSVGVSFNKVFAKLGSDMKKPDATTVIGQENFRELVWPLHVSELLYVGRATTRKLESRGIYTIGDIARTTPDFMRRLLGANGVMIWNYASGYDNAQVMPADYKAPAKSIGHGVTCTADLENEEEVWHVFLELAQQVGHRLRVHGQAACGLAMAVKDAKLYTQSWQTQLNFPTQSPRELAMEAMHLFVARYGWRWNVRALSITATHLSPADLPQQLSLFDDMEKREKQERLDNAVEAIRNQFGPRAIVVASLLRNTKLPSGKRPPRALPGMMYR